MSSQPGDPTPFSHPDDGRDEPDPITFARTTKTFLKNPWARILMAIAVVLIVILGIVMVSSVSSTSKEPGTGSVPTPLVVRAAVPAAAPLRLAA